MTSGMDRGEAAKQEAKDLKEGIRERGEEVKERAKHEAERVVDELGESSRRQANRQADWAADSLRGLADQLESMSRTSAEQGFLVDLARDGAEKAYRFADQLDEDGIDGVVRQVEDFARRRPGMFIAAGVGVGMVLGRWLRSADLGRMKQAMADGPSSDRDEEIDLDRYEEPWTAVGANSAPSSSIEPGGGLP